MLLGGFEASVKVDDVALDEYAVEISEDGKRATCWIPSQEGKAFGIYWTDLRNVRTATCGYPRVDGVKIGGKIICPDHGPFKSKLNRSHQSHIRTSKTATRALKFATVELTGAYDDDAQWTTPSINLGEIQINIERVEILRVVAGDKARDGGYKLPEHEKVHEKSKKSGAHRVGLGEEVQKTLGTVMDTKDLDIEPLVSFIFRYRPLEFLKATGVAPRSTPPKRPATDEPTDPAPASTSNVEVKDDPEDHATQAEQQEIFELEARLNELKAKHPGASRPAKRVKREPISHQGVFTQGEVIDLT